jgi:hypothetical protein
MNRQKILDKIAYRIYEIRTKDINSPLFGYGDEERDYYLADRILHFIENLEEYNLDDPMIRTQYEDYIDLYGDILQEIKDE